MNIFEFEFGIFNTSLRSGIRPGGRLGVNKFTGRQNHGILYLFSGAVEFKNTEYRSILKAEGGELVYIPKGEKYEMRYLRQTNFALINFDAILPNGEDAVFSDGIEVIIKSDKDAELNMIFSNVARLSASEETYSSLKTKELMYRLFSYLNESFSNVDKRIEGGVRLLREKFLSDIPITEIAAASFLSVSNFRKIFFRQFGTSPIQYRNSLRLKYAEKLLSDGEYYVSEVARLSGFNNECYFCRLYKKAFGITPKSRRMKEIRQKSLSE